MKSARQDRRDEIRGQAFHDLVAGHHASQELASRAARDFGSHDRRWQNGTTWVCHHPEGVPLASSKHHLCIDEGSSSTREASPVDQCRGRAGDALLLFFDQANGLLCFGEFMAQQSRGQALQSDAASAVESLRWDIRKAEPGYPARQAAIDAFRGHTASMDRMTRDQTGECPGRSVLAAVSGTNRRFTASYMSLKSAARQLATEHLAIRSRHVQTKRLA